MLALPTSNSLRSYAPLLLLNSLALLLFALLVTGSTSAAPLAPLAPLVPAQPLTTSSASPHSPNACNNYLIASSPGTITSGTTDIGNHCDDCVTPIQLPFSFTLYDQTSNVVNVSSNGLLSLQVHTTTTNACLPAEAIDYSILPYWDNLRTDCQSCGIFTSTTGSAPNRKFNIEWRTTYASNQGSANFEVQLIEGSPTFAVILGDTTEAGAGATIGVQELYAGCHTEYKCNSGGLVSGLVLTFYPSGVQPTSTSISTSTPTHTRTPAPTITPGGPSATPTTCPLPFTDVHSTDYFYTPVAYLYCHGMISGYADNTFRPYNNTTRSQLVKLDVLGFALPIATPTPSGTYTFADVPPSHPFYPYIETAASHNVISGYDCGGPGELCDPLSRPYFRPYNNVTRSQLTKIVVTTAGWPLQNPPTGTFEDVLPLTAFYQYIETAACHHIVSGYNCGNPGEPCDPLSRPYFHPYANATRGQIAKIVYLSITGSPSCSP